MFSLQKAASHNSAGCSESNWKLTSEAPNRNALSVFVSFVSFRIQCSYGTESALFTGTLLFGWEE